MKQKQIDDQKSDTLYSKQSIRSLKAIVVYIHGKVNKATRKAWHFHTIWYYRNKLSFHDVDCSTSRRQLTQQPSPYTHCNDVFNTDAKRQLQAAIQRWSFIPTRPPGDCITHSTQQQEDAWSDGPGGGVLQVKGGHTKPQGGTPRTGRTLWAYVVSKVDFNYFRFRKSQYYTLNEPQTISGTFL